MEFLRLKFRPIDAALGPHGLPLNNGWVAMAMALLSSSIALPAQQFTDQADAYGINIGTQGHTWGNGVSFFDVNEDGFDDITLLSNNANVRLYLASEEGLTVIDLGIYVAGAALHPIWVDYDNDGDYDLYITVRDGINQLWRNEGNWSFTDVTAEAGLMVPISGYYGASFGDYNRDGWLDLYICRYESPNPPGYGNTLFRNEGDGTFTDVTDELAVGDGLKPSFMAAWIDINNNNWPDLFVMNDRFPANSLYKNLEGTNFEDITESAQVAFPFNDPMSLSVADYDNDGDLDIFMTNSGWNENMPVILLNNNGNETFTEMSEDNGISVNSISWGATWIDYNNDGWRDLFFCMSGQAPNRLYRNDLGSFTQVSNLLSASLKFSYVCAAGDFNNDGYADLVIQNRLPQQPQLLVNSGGASNYIKI